MRIVDAYYEDLKIKRLEGNSWRGAKYSDYNVEDAAENVFTITQINNSNELYKEGKRMSHCVNTYAKRCKNRSCSIWSLREKLEDSWKSIATIEVNYRHEIVQAKGKYNKRPESKHLDVIKEWAEREKLIYICY